MDGDSRAANNRAQALVLEDQARIQLALDGAYAGLFEGNGVTNRSEWSTGFYRLHGLRPGGPASCAPWR
jgi:hypothetical protein